MDTTTPIMPIAVVGMACRLPGGVDNLESFWDFCEKGLSAWTEIPQERMNASAYQHPNPEKAGHFNITGGHFLKDSLLAAFDAGFFNITAEEAKALDPRHRLLLECAYEALENGGIPMKSIAGGGGGQQKQQQKEDVVTVGVFVGATLSNYSLLCLRDLQTAPRLQYIGCLDALLANRISYFFDLHGPSVTVDTACSSGGSAIHLACQSLRQGESSIAIVGGAHLNIAPEVLASAASLRLYSDEGKSFPFDDRVTGGFGPGEGSACVILKPLQKAIDAGDNIRAIIRNTGTNQDGRTLGISRPSADAQAALIRSVYKSAQLDIAETAYVEAHGTGTKVGDPIEAAAIASTFVAHVDDSTTDPVFIGSAKSNFGHLEGVSGILSLIKATMMLAKGVILPNANFENPNPEIPSIGKGLKVPKSALEWPRTAVRRASVNNFGFGGTNVHLILENAPQLADVNNNERNILPNGINGAAHSVDINADANANGEKISPTIERTSALPNGNENVETNKLSIVHFPDDYSSEHTISTTTYHRLYVLTANHPNSLISQVDALALYLGRKISNERPDSEPEPEPEEELMSNLAFTLCQRRSILPWKVSFTASTAKELRNLLESSDPVPSPSRSTKAPTIGFVFTGQGANWHAMGRELFAVYPVFASTIAAADAHLESLGAPWSLKGELFKDAKSSLLGQAHVSQPACTAIQIALVKLLDSWGIRPDAVVGHSSGEIAAAYAAGALTLESCISIAYYRGLVASDMKEKFPEVKGAMLAVGTDQRGMSSIIDDQLESQSSSRVVVACINSPNSITVSGDANAIADLQKVLEEKKIFARKLQVDVAYHSHHMGLIAEDYRKAIGTIRPASGSRKVEFFSSLLGKKTSTLALSSTYWARNLKSPVLFSAALSALCEREGSVTHLIEIGPHSALKGPIRDVLVNYPGSKTKICYIPTLLRNQDAIRTMVQLASNLFIGGCQLEMSAINFPQEAVPKPAVLSDLSPYRWNRESEFWHESRISQSHLKKKNPHNDILGSLTANSNDTELTWRNIIRLDDIPWLRDHKILSQVIFPFTGYVTMAVEAIAQQQTNIQSAQSTKISIREMLANQALIIPEDVEVETMLTMRPVDEGTRMSSKTWKEFKIFSWTAARGWLEHCRGHIAVFGDKKPNEVDGEKDSSSIACSQIHTQISSIKAACKSPLDSQKIYESVRGSGIEYGPCMNSFSDCYVGSNCALGVVKVPDTASTMPYQHETSMVVHPCLLDNCIHILWPLLGAGQAGLDGQFVPSFVKSISIRPSMRTQVEDSLPVFGSRATTSSSFEKTIKSIFVFEPDNVDQLPVIIIEGLVMTTYSDAPPPVSSKTDISKYAMVTWNLCLDSLRSDEHPESLQLEAAPESETAKMRAYEQVTLYYFEAALEKVNDEQYYLFLDHHKKFYRTMQKQLSLARGGQNPLLAAGWDVLTDSEREDFKKMVNSLDATGELLCRLGENIPKILSQSCDVLSLMLEDHLLERHYRQNSSLNRAYKSLAMLVDIIAHENPNLRILEIGAGTGGASLPTLEAFSGASNKSLPRFQEYVFTDISSGFFENAKTKLKAWAPLVTFGKLDIEQEPVCQGYEAESFDLIIAAIVLHATSDINRTMQHVRKLLKPGGKLLLLESTTLMFHTFPFALLPGWWLSQEDFRVDGPLLREDQWDLALQTTGFSGIDHILRDYVGETTRFHSVMLSTAKVPALIDPVISNEILVVQSHQCDRLSLDVLKEQLSLFTGRNPRIISLEELIHVDVHDSDIIFLDELQQPILAHLSEISYQAVQILCTTPRLLWVVSGAQIQSSTPESAMAIGLARCIRTEIPGIKFVTLDLDEKQKLSAKRTSEVIADLYRRVFVLKAQEAIEFVDLEYTEREGFLNIPRIVDHENMDDFVQKSTEKEVLEYHTYLQDGPDRAVDLKIQTVGLLDSLYFLENDRNNSFLKPDEVQIQVKACSLNFRDVLIALGQVPLDSLGIDCAGLITEIGCDVQDLAVGDRVCAVSPGALCTFFRCASSCVVQIPESTAFDVAASLPVICGTAYRSLVTVAGLCEEESILIHAAAGGVGQAAIMLSQSIGAEIFATVGSFKKKELLISRYGIEPDHIFFSRDTSFEEGIMRKTNGKGVDVILNSLTGESLRASWRCLASFGRFIEIGKKDILSNNNLEMEPFIENRSYASVDLLGISKQRPREMKKLLLETIQLHEAGIFQPVSSIITFPLSDAEKAFRTLASGEAIGKVVLIPQVGDRIKLIPCMASISPISQEGTYIITGGSGGIGRALTYWLANHGAKGIILASRSSKPNEKTRALIEQLTGRGTNVVYRQCDVTVREEVERLVKESSGMPRIRGVIHGAVVERDKFFETLSFEEYKAVIKPKVVGAWNLHHALLEQEPLDFFVSLASVVGIIGNHGQAAYGATTTFLSSFASYRSSLGLAASTVNLGAVADVGYLAEQRPDLQPTIKALTGTEIYENELVAIIEAAVRGIIGQDSNYHSITGLVYTGAKIQTEIWSSDTKFSHMRHKRGRIEGPDLSTTNGSAAAVDTRSVYQQLTPVNSVEKAKEIVYNSLAAKVSSVLMLHEDDITAQKALGSYGIDSLVAVELRNWIGREMEATVMLMDLLADNTLAVLTETVWKKSKLCERFRALEVLDVGIN